MAINGHISLHRKLIEWEWFTDINTCQLFIYCLLRANYKEVVWQNINIKRGQFVTSINQLSMQTGQTFQQIRTSLKKLQKTNEITVNSTNKNTIVTIIKYDTYQIQEIETNKQITNEQQTNNKQITTDNKDNKDNKIIIKNIKEEEGRKIKNFSIPTQSEINNYFLELKSDLFEAEKFNDYYTANGWMQSKNKIKDWKATARNWNRNAMKFSNNGVQNANKSSYQRKQEFTATDSINAINRNKEFIKAAANSKFLPFPE